MALFPEPTWAADGQQVVIPPSSLCFMKDPSIITGVFLQFTRCMFFSADSIVNEQLKGYIWTDASDSRIVIDPSYKWNSKNVQQRPSIYIKREAVSINSQLGLGAGQHVSHFNADGNHRGVDNTVLMSGGHSLICIGQSSSEAENIGHELLFKFIEYREPLQKEAKLGKLAVGGLSSVSKADENKENWVVVISLAWAYSHNWTLYQEAPILKKMALGVAL